LNFKCYVVKTDVITNTVIVGDKSHEELSHDSLLALNRHWIAQKHELPLKVKTKIRYRQEPQPAKLVSFENNKINISFDEPQWAITSGQVVVAYL